MSLGIRELLPYSDESIMLSCSALCDWSGYGISTQLLVLVLSSPFCPKALTSLEELMFSHPRHDGSDWQFTFKAPSFDV